MQMVDLRSDTLTHPTEAMRRAMAEAEVGDDVFGEDPTVIRLEEMAARAMGTEAALLVASGTMANLVCQLSHCRRGDEMLLGDQSHIYFYEQGGSAAVGGIHPRPLPNQADGSIDLSAIREAVRADDVHFPRSRLLALENTHNRCSGSPLDADYMQSAIETAHALGMKVHVDGARIFNAAVALNVPPARLVAGADSVSFCLSKALAAPVGSLVCGSSSFVMRARRARKLLGGGMRQAGVLAAAGIVALSTMVDRLAEDHRHARLLAQALNAMDGLCVDVDRVRTDIVYIDVAPEAMSAAELATRLADRGVKVLATGAQRLRAVTHYQIGENDIHCAIDAFDRALAKA